MIRKISQTSIVSSSLVIIFSRFKCSSDSSKLTTEYLKSKFNQFNKNDYNEYLISKNSNISKLKQSSVLVPLSIRLDKNDVPKTFYTLSKRTETMDSFKGQVCFVGGKRDPIDKSAIDTAYREANEEINIESTQLTFLAQLSPILTSNGILIHPIIAYFDKTNYKPILNKTEVDMIFELPTDRFLSKINHQFKSIKYGSNEYYVHYFEDFVNDKKIITWGATAFLSIIISSIIHSKTPEFTVDPKLELTNDNLINYLENYLLIKSEKLINHNASKYKKK